MSALTLSAKLDRTDSNTTWGFRMHGGKDFGCPLSIQRVTPGSLAHKCGLQVGDTIAKIGGSPTELLRHKEAQNMILHAGNSLELALIRGGAGGAPRAAPPQQQYSAPPPPAASAYQPPPAAPFSPSGQNYNTAPRPFPGSGTVPVAVNSQYNTPLSMYSVDNVMDSLSGQTRNMGLSEPDVSSRYGHSGPSATPVRPSVVHTQFNTPIGLYNTSNISEAYHDKSTGLASDAPRGGHENTQSGGTKLYQPSNTFHMVQQEDSLREPLGENVYRPATVRPYTPSSPATASTQPATSANILANRLGYVLSVKGLNYGETDLVKQGVMGRNKLLSGCP